MSSVGAFIRALHENGASRSHMVRVIGELDNKVVPFSQTAALLLSYDLAVEKIIELLESVEADRKRYLNIAVNWNPPKPRTDEAPVWVYVMAVDHPGDTLVKIGISKQPQFRLSTLEKERGYNLYLAHTEGPFARPKAADIERAAHDRLAEYRERGEWFECGVDLAMEAVKACAEGAPK